MRTIFFSKKNSKYVSPNGGRVSKVSFAAMHWVMLQCAQAHDRCEDGFGIV